MSPRGRPRSAVDVALVRALRSTVPPTPWQTIERRTRISARTLKRHVRDAERGPSTAPSSAGPAKRDGDYCGTDDDHGRCKLLDCLLGRWAAGDTPDALEADYHLCKGTLDVLREVRR